MEAPYSEHDEPMSPYRRLADATVHEVRNALNAMAIHLEVLADRFDEAEEEAQVGSVAALRVQIGRIESIMRRFHGLACPPVEEGRVALSELVYQVAEACHHDARRHSVAVEIDLSPVSVEGRLPALTEAVLRTVLRGIQEFRGGQLRISLVADGTDALLSLTGQSANRIDLRLSGTSAGPRS